MSKMYLTVILAIFLFFPASAFSDETNYNWLDSGYTKEWSRIKESSKTFYRGVDPSILSIDPIHLPEGKNLVMSNRTFSRPVICKVGDTLIVCYMRREFHWRWPKENNKNEQSSYSVVTISRDHGKSWSAPRSLSHELQGGSAAKHAVTGNGCVFYVLDEGKEDEEVILVTSSGVYATKDRGITWDFLEAALTENQTPIGGNFSRQGIVHPEHGMVFFAHFQKRRDDLSKLRASDDDGVTGNGTGIDQRVMAFMSKDRGRTWSQAAFDPGTPEIAKFIEPTAILHEGELFFLSRNMDTASREPIQAYSKSGWFPLDYVKTYDFGIPTIGAGSHPDTPDLIYNPVTDRIEVLLCNRFGGGPANPNDKVKSLHLFSISPAKFRQGSTDWRFEATLLEQVNFDDRADGMQPCGTAVDLERGVQYVAVMLGDVNHTAGDYLITRTLDTPKLREEFLKLGPVK